jgi:hypothetical protein
MGTRCCFILIVAVVELNVIIKFASHIGHSALEIAISFESLLHAMLHRGDPVPLLVNICYDHADIPYSISLLCVRLAICIGRVIEAVLGVNSDTDLEFQLEWEGSNHPSHMGSIVFVVGKPY